MRLFSLFNGFPFIALPILLTAFLCASQPAEAQIYTPQWKVGGLTDRKESPGKFRSDSAAQLPGARAPRNG